MSTTKAARSPADTVVSMGAESRDILGGWRLLKRVSRTVDRSGRGRVDGRASVNRLGLESMRRNLPNRIRPNYNTDMAVLT